MTGTGPSLRAAVTPFREDSAGPAEAGRAAPTGSGRTVPGRLAGVSVTAGDGVPMGASAVRRPPAARPPAGRTLRRRAGGAPVP